MRTLIASLFCIILLQAQAQDTTTAGKWTLQRCVDYAIKNNISVRQADVQARISALQAKQATWNQYPTAAFSTGISQQFGRSSDPTTNQFTTNSFTYQNYQLQGGAVLFNFGQLNNSRKAAQFNAAAALIDVERAANDVSINVATYYLQVLASKEQIGIAAIQVQQDSSQLSDTKHRVDAGALPELNLAEIESQLATDSSNLITAKETYEQNVLSLKAVLNLDAGALFELDTPPVDRIPLQPLADLQPESVYQLAINNQPLQKENALKIKGAEKSIGAAKGALYPSISGSYGLGSAFNSKSMDLISYNYISPPIGKVSIGANDYTVYSDPVPNPTYGKSPYSSQLSDNFNQTLGIGLSIPIFRNGTNRINYQTAKLNLKNLELQKEQADMQLKQNIYSAYVNAAASMQKFNAGKKSVDAAQKAYDFSVKRYKVGLLGTIDLLTNQNNLLKAKQQQLSNQYDYVFRMKLLEFYKGQGMRLQ